MGSFFEVTKTVGNSTFVFKEEYQDHKEFFRKASFTSSLPNKCAECSGVELKFEERSAETKDGRECSYYEIACQNLACRYRLQFGVHNNGKGTLFPKGWEPPYAPGGPHRYQEGGVNQPAIHSTFAPPSDIPYDEEIPFPPTPHKPLLNPGRELIGSADEWKNHPATDKQTKALWAIAKQAGHDEFTLKKYLWELFGEKAYDAGGKVSTKALTKGMVSEAIDRLKKESGHSDGNE